VFLLKAARVLFVVLCIGLFFRLLKQWRARKARR
jgi:hypothetical protein